MRHEFNSPGEYLQLLAYRGMNAGDRTIFGRQAARLEQLAAGSDEAREASDSAGGFAVFQSFMADTLNRGFDLSTIASRCRRLPPIQGAEVKAPVWHETSRQNGSRLGGISSAWRGETLPIASSLGAFAGLVLAPQPLKVLFYCTEELLMDAATLEDTWRAGVAEEIAARTEQALLGTSLTDADGVGCPSGIQDDPSLIVIPKDQGQAGQTISATNIINCVGRLFPPCHKNAIWTCSISALSAILASVELNQSGLLRFAGPALGDGTPKMTLAGFPLYCVEACQPVGTQCDLILGDWSQVVIAEKVPQFSDSGDVRFIFHEHCFKLVVRLTGHSSWLGPVTSMNESTTVSPFIAIDNRS